MSEAFLLAASDERQAVYRAGAELTGLPTKILEKDVWICWTLGVLFGQAGHPPMAFKGGTSLSKVFGVIDRFSEDIDVTVAVPSHDPDNIPASRKKRDALRETLHDELKVHLEETIVPLLGATVSEYAIAPEQFVTKLDDETVVLDYPSCYEKQGGYLAERVKIEFGARNQLTPSEPHIVEPYIADLLGEAEVTLPTATVDVLSPRRTFWEKATLAHDECNRGAWDRGAERISRHWYDLAKLADHTIGADALEDWDLLSQVVDVKKAFYSRSTSRYEDCLTGGLRLIPDAAGLVVLRRDYEAMVSSGMFHDEPPSFDWVIERVRALEQTINAGSSSRVTG